MQVRDLDVLYLYPRTGRLGIPMLPGWDETPGARGCTPQSCGFRDAHGELRALGKRVAGISTQPLSDQIEFAERNAMPFPVVADPERRLGDALGFPTFEVAGETLYKRLALVAENGDIVRSSTPSSRQTRMPATSWPGCERDEARHLRRGPRWADRRRGDRRSRRADDAGVVRSAAAPTTRASGSHWPRRSSARRSARRSSSTRPGTSVSTRRSRKSSTGRTRSLRGSSSSRTWTRSSAPTSRSCIPSI